MTISARRLGAPFALLAATVVLSVPTAAQAASSITSVTSTNGDYVVDKTAVVSVDRFLDPTDSEWGDVSVDVNPNGIPCGDTYETNRGNSIDDFDVWENPSSPTELARLNWTPGVAGEFTLCTYLEWSGADFAAFSTPIVVRQPKVSLDLSLAATNFAPGQTTPLTITASAEVKRWVWVAQNVTGVPCGANLDANVGDVIVSSYGVLGQQAPEPQNVTVDSTGSFHLCGYVASASNDPSPLLVKDGPSFSVGSASASSSAAAAVAVSAPPATSGPSCAISPTTVDGHTRLRVLCSNVSGNITVSARQGAVRVRRAVSTVAGAANLTPSNLRLRGHGRATISVAYRGHTLATRAVHIR